MVANLCNQNDYAGVHEMNPGEIIRALLKALEKIFKGR